MSCLLWLGLGLAAYAVGWWVGSAFFRGYYHYKSADWKGNEPHPLKGRTAEEMAKIPTYYVMDKDKGMAETAASQMPSAEEIAACKWLTDAEVGVYVTEYSRTGFIGALHWTDPYAVNDPHALTMSYFGLFQRLGGAFALGDATTLQQNGAGWRVK